MKVNQEQTQRREPLLSVDDVALSTFIADDNRPEEVAPICSDGLATVFRVVVIEKCGCQILDQIPNLLALPFVFALVIINVIAFPVQQFTDGSTFAVYLFHAYHLAQQRETTQSKPLPIYISK